MEWHSVLTPCHLVPPLECTLLSMELWGHRDLARTGVSQYSAHNFDSKGIFVLCFLQVRDCVITPDFMFEGFFKNKL